MSGDDTRLAANDLERWLAILLRLGVLSSAAVILTGVAMSIWIGNTGYADGGFPHSLIAVFNGLMEFKPFAVVMLGLFILIMTPVFQVVTCAAIFWRLNDRPYALLALFILAILMISFTLGKASG